jgi:hypothetical protein
MSSSSFWGRATIASLLVASVTGCERDLDLLEPAEFPSNPVVFQEFLTDGISFQAFSGAKLDAFSVDPEEGFRGANAIKITIPNPPSFAGGAFVAPVPRNLTSYNALSFWGRSSTDATMNVIGLANDNTGNSRYQTEIAGQLEFTSQWQRYLLPIPNPDRLTEEGGMLWFAEGAENGLGYELWIDEVEFVDVGTIANPRPSIPDQTVTGVIGGTLNVTGAQIVYDVAGTDITVGSLPGNFDFESSDDTVVEVGADGSLSVVGSGTAVITASIDGVPATGALTVNVPGPPNGPAPTPTRPGSEVTSLFSDVYDDNPVDTWSAGFDQADVQDIQIDGDNVKLYTNSVFAGVEFLSAPVDATTREGIHIDLWVDDPSDFRLKLVDLGDDGVFGGGNESESEIFLSETSTPPLRFGQWNSLDIPFTEFPGGLTNRSNLGQMIFSGANSTYYIDNVYFYGEVERVSVEPAEAAPAPTYAADDVISLFSNEYTNVPVPEFSAFWDNANVEDVQIAGNDTKKYTGLVFAGINLEGASIDASSMTSFRVDIWTGDDTTLPSRFRVRIVDWGPDGVPSGDDSAGNFEIDTTTMPALRTGEWVTIDVPLSSFPGLNTTANISQFVFEDLDRGISTFFMDNLLFHR